MAAADRAFVWELVRLGVARPFFQDHAQDLRDHIAGALDHHRVADPHIQTRDLVFIVQGGIAHHHAADRDRLQPRHRRQLAGTAHLDLDILQHGLGLLGREFVGGGPARTA